MKYSGFEINSRLAETFGLNEFAKTIFVGKKEDYINYINKNKSEASRKR